MFNIQFNDVGLAIDEFLGDESLNSAINASQFPILRETTFPETITVHQQSKPEPTRISNFYQKKTNTSNNSGNSSIVKPKITIDDIPDDLLILITKQIRDELLEKCMEEIKRIKEESRRELEKIRIDLLSENEEVIQRRVKEEFDKLVKSELDKHVKIKLEEQQEYWNNEFKRQTAQWVSLFCQNEPKQMPPQTFDFQQLYPKEPVAPTVPTIVLPVKQLQQHQPVIVQQPLQPLQQTVPVQQEYIHQSPEYVDEEKPEVNAHKVKQYQHKQKQIDMWKNAERVHEAQYLEQKSLLDEFFVRTRSFQDRRIDPVTINRVISGIQWISSHWDKLELSFKHREDFISTKILGILLQDNDLILNEANMSQIESEIALESRKLQNLLSMQEYIEMSSKREKAKLRVDALNTQIQQAKKLEKPKLISERTKKMAEIVQLGEKIESQIDKLEKKNGQELLFRGLRYRDILNFDRLKKEYEEDLENQEQIKKWSNRIAKKFA